MIVTLVRMKVALLVGLAACVAASVVACSSSPVTRGSRSSASAASPTRSSSASARGTATTITSTCAAQSLRVQGGRQGGGGIAHGDVDITNLAATACTLAAPHSLTLLSASRTALDVQFTPATSTLQPVTIPSGKAARLSLSWSNWCHANPGPLTISITGTGAGAGEGGTISGPFNGPPDYNYVPPCLASNQPSTMQLIGLALQP